MIKLKDKPEALLTNVPESFFKEDRPYLWGNDPGIDKRMDNFLKWYLDRTDQEDPIFYHFIPIKPVQEVSTVFICWGGQVRLKAQIVEFRFGTLAGVAPHERWWMITGGPAIKAPDDMPMTGFRGFRYTKMLF